VKRIDSETAFEIWRILVDRAGANDGLMAQDCFIQYVTSHETVQEYRFMGHLGMGGKVRLLPEAWTVYYYPEDKNELREQIAANANYDLAQLKQIFEEE
jgi:hypothetical protein